MMRDNTLLDGRAAGKLFISEIEKMRALARA
jgi:hypothetical protein